jgi:hypothetical protein
VDLESNSSDKKKAGTGNTVPDITEEDDSDIRELSTPPNE